MFKNARNTLGSMLEKMAEFIKGDSPKIITSQTNPEDIELAMRNIDEKAAERNHQILLARLTRLDKAFEKLRGDVGALTDLTVNIGTQVETFYNEFSTALDTTTMELQDDDDKTLAFPEKKVNSPLN